MDDTTQRKRQGRPSKNSVVGTHRPHSSVGLVEGVVDDESNDLTIQESVVDAGVVSEIIQPAFLAVSPTSECRRSARKKIIKFDVRDLLNKNRKAHKIQIEARIDSNAPPSIGIPLTTQKTADVTKLTNVPRPMPIVNRRYSMFVRPTKDPELLVMQQKPANSLILAQVANTSTNRGRDDSAIGVKKPSTAKSPVVKFIDEFQMPKKRGRPRKIKQNNIKNDDSSDGNHSKLMNEEESDDVIDLDADTTNCVYKESDVLDTTSMESLPCKNFYVALKRLPISTIENSPCAVSNESSATYTKVTLTENTSSVGKNEYTCLDESNNEQISMDLETMTKPEVTPTRSNLANTKLIDDIATDFDQLSKVCIKTKEDTSCTFINVDDTLQNPSSPSVIKKESSKECQNNEWSDIESIQRKIDSKNFELVDESNARNDSVESPATLKGLSSSPFEESLSLDGNLSESTTSSTTTIGSQSRVRRSRRMSVFCNRLVTKGTLEEQYVQIKALSSKEVLSSSEAGDTVCDLSVSSDSKQSELEVFSMAKHVHNVDDITCKPALVQIENETKVERRQSALNADMQLQFSSQREQLENLGQVGWSNKTPTENVKEELQPDQQSTQCNSFEKITLPVVDNTAFMAITLAQSTDCHQKEIAINIDFNTREEQNLPTAITSSVINNESSDATAAGEFVVKEKPTSMKDSPVLERKPQLQFESSVRPSRSLSDHAFMSNLSNLYTVPNCEDSSLLSQTKTMTMSQSEYSLHANQDEFLKSAKTKSESVEGILDLHSSSEAIETVTAELERKESTPPDVSPEMLPDNKAKNLDQSNAETVPERETEETYHQNFVTYGETAREEVRPKELVTIILVTNVNSSDSEGTSSARLVSEAQEESSESSNITEKNRSETSTPISEAVLKSENSIRTSLLSGVTISDESISSTPESTDSTQSSSSNKETDSADSFLSTLYSNKFSNKRQGKRRIKGIELTTMHRSINSSPVSLDDSKTCPSLAPIQTATVVSEDDALDPLKDIEKFIEDGVNLLKRDYKLDDDSVDNELSTSVSTKPNLDQDVNAEFAERVRNFETPADSPETVTSVSSPSSPLAPSPVPSILSTDEVVSGVRRSHRIKQKPQAPKALVGRGVVRDGECTVAYSVDEHLIELAQIEAINEKFLKTERLNFHMIRENIYKCGRMVSKETVDMQCECFLTAEEEVNGQWGCGEGCINRMLMIECGPQCSNRERCTNNRFQKQLCSPCRVFRTEKKGCGIVAEVQILPGDFVMEYVGEVIDSEEFERRQFLYSKDKNRHYYFMALRPDAIIDATVKGNISRFINHSCDPNAETQKWTVNGELRIGFFSRKTIMPGEEITFDYQYQRYGRDAQPCFCEAASCRGWIGEKPASDDEDDSDSERDIEGESSVEEESSAEGSEEDSQLSRKMGVVREKKSKSRKITTGEEDGKPKAIRTPDKPRLKNHKLDQQKVPNQQRDKDREDKDPKLSRAAAIRKAERRTEKERRMRFLEDPDVEEEVTKLSRSGLKNQANTLRLSRLMVRAKLVQTRLNLLGILQRGEVPCRRLFLDYHGLRLLHGWMNENGNEIEFRRALLETLESLPIPNKTMLTDSKIYQTVKNWNTAELTQSQPQQPQMLPSNNASNEELAKEVTITQPSASESEIVQKRVDSLIVKWDGLPEIFRIPKRERIEQMKEHEREADRHIDATALDDNLTVTPLESDRYKRDRFGRDTSSRYVKPSATANGNIVASPITTVKDSRHSSGSNGSSGSSYKSESRRRSEGPSSSTTYERNKYLPKELRREMFERKVARDEAEKRMAEERRIFEIKCHFFGLDPLSCDPQLMPTSENIETGEFFNIDGLPVPPPPRCGDPSPAPPMQLTDPALYELPDAAKQLPPTWTFAITPDGYIYYINLVERIAQWEPPTEEQIQITEELYSESDTNDDSDDSLGETMVDIDGEYAASLKPDQLNEYIKEKIKERRQKRYERLVSVREISPRRDEDRVYNQIEARKYKENKEKIRRRKEAYRRRRIEIGAHPVAKGVSKTTDESECYATLPIQDYLYSSDEASEIDECNNSPLIDVIVQEDKIVDEVDALNSRRHLKRSLPLPPLNMEPSTSKAAASKLRSLPMPQISFETKDGLKEQTASPNAVSPKCLTQESIVASANGDEERVDYKRRRLEREKKRAGSNISSSVKDKFRSDVARIIVEYLKPYRKESCQRGRITNDQDFNHLARRLTHYIMTKEMKYCDLIGQTLVVNDSVRHKSREYIKLYMQKYGRIYKRPENAPEFKEIRIPALS